MEKHFKVGDFVRRILSGEIVKIEVIKEDWIAYREARLMTGACPMEEVEPVDPKTAFLSELKGLLEKYGAAIDCSDFDTGGEWWYEKWLSIKIGEEVIRWFDDGDSATENRGRKPPKSHFPITPDNIMDYNKE